jgi:magnesium transporter
MELSLVRAAETAAQHLVRRVLVVRAEEKVGAALSRLPGQTYDCLDAAYVTDDEGHLRGLIRLTDLLALPPERTVGESMTADPPRVRPPEDQEQIALLALRHAVAAVPVVDDGGRLLGVVPPGALIEILRREHVEDLHRLTGILTETDQARSAIESPPGRRLRQRLPWLLVGLLGSIVATAIMAGFERTLEARVAIAFFVPAIVYLADAIGTQTEAIAVRFLSLRHAPLGRLLGGELVTGLLIGLALGVLIFPTVLFAFSDLRLALAVTLSVVAAGCVASAAGLVFPWMLSRAGMDPAFGSGPVATIVQDVLSLLIYFVIVCALRV